MVRWTASNIPSQKGRLAVVTGTGGLGYEDALALSQAGAEVVIAGRDPAKGAMAVEKIRTRLPSAQVRFERLDLASLHSVAGFCHRLSTQTDRLDLLINNAGVMMPPKRLETEDGFEMQMGTNHLGHFALTAGLMPLLRRAHKARVISVSSVAARNGVIDFDNLNAERSYNPMRIYSQSKLACLMFALELHRRSEAAGWGVAGIASHPGVARTDLIYNAPGRQSLLGMTRSTLWFLFQPVWQGALPTLFAATSPLARSGAYYGPGGLSEVRGYPASARIPEAALDIKASARLWEASQALTGVAF